MSHKGVAEGSRTESGVLGHLELLDERYPLVFAGFGGGNAFQVARHELSYDHQLTGDRAGSHEKHNCQLQVSISTKNAKKLRMRRDGNERLG
jgi:hypothetical protein